MKKPLLMRSPEEIEQLKQSWSRDPHWDIEHTEGFEVHRKELKEYSDNMHAIWYQEAEERTKAEMIEMGITDPSIYRQFKNLMYTIDALEKRIEKLEDAN